MCLWQGLRQSASRVRLVSAAALRCLPVERRGTAVEGWGSCCCCCAPIGESVAELILKLLLLGWATHQQALQCRRSLPRRDLCLTCSPTARRRYAQIELAPRPLFKPRFRVHWGSGQTPSKLLQTENNMKLFERDLGEGRKIVPEPDQVKDDKSRLPAPLPFKKAERATPDMKV